MLKHNFIRICLLGALFLQGGSASAQVAFIAQPKNINTNANAFVSLNVAAAGLGTLSYQWFKDPNTNVIGTLTNLNFSPVALGDSGAYYVRVHDDSGYYRSSNAVLNVGISNQFTLQPASLIATQGQNATFTAASSGTPVQYYWRRSAVFISGATNASLTVSNVTYAANNRYNYTCQISNFLNSVTSTNALLTVYYPPTISAQPVGETNGVGTTFALSVTANGNPALSYQWRTNGVPISGQTSSSCTISAAQTGNSGIYDVVITNSVGTTNSKAVMVSVVYYPPVVTLQPVGTNVPFGNPFTLQATASGTAPLTWQWRTNDTPIPGATNNSYAVTAAQFTDAGAYDVVVTNVVGGTNSNVVQVNVGYAPVIVQQPLSLTNNAGDTVNFSCLATGSAPVSVQWTLNGYPIPAQTDFSVTLTNVQATNIGYYALVATNIFGSVVSSNAALNLNGFNFFQWAGLEAYYALDGNTLDSSGFGNDGTNFGTLAATDRFGNTNGAMSFDGNAHYIQCKAGPYFGSNYTVSAWVNAAAYNSFSRILDFGNGGPRYNTDLALSGGTDGQPYFEVYIGASQIGDCTSPTVIPLNKWTQVVGTCDGSHLTLYFNGFMESQASLQLVRQPITTIRNYLGKSNWTGDQYFDGSFDDIRIFDRALSSSDVAQLFALEGDVPVITQQPQAQTVNAGSTVSFSVVATANHPLTYQWRTNDVPITGATNSVLTVSNVQSANVGFYSVAVSNSVTGVFSAGALLNLTGAADPTWNGLVAYYPLNGNALDLSGNGNDGTNFGAVAASDRFGNSMGAMLFNGINNYIQCKTGAYFGSNFTISAWANASAFLNDSRILDFGNGAGRYNTVLDLSSSTTGQALFYVASGPTELFDFAAPSAMGLNTWTHVVATCDGAVERIYYDGAIQVQANIVVNRPSGRTTLNYLGRSNWNGDAYLAGSLDDIRIYNRALSPDEVAYLYGLESQSSLLPSPKLAACLGSGPSLNLSLTGVPGGSYVLQTATNLLPPIQWLPVLTNAADTNGLWQFTDTNLDYDQKFYRVTTP